MDKRPMDWFEQYFKMSIWLWLWVLLILCISSTAYTRRPGSLSASADAPLSLTYEGDGITVGASVPEGYPGFPEGAAVAVEPFAQFAVQDEDAMELAIDLPGMAMDVLHDAGVDGSIAALCPYVFDITGLNAETKQVKFLWDAVIPAPVQTDRPADADEFSVYWMQFFDSHGDLSLKVVGDLMCRPVFTYDGEESYVTMDGAEGAVGVYGAVVVHEGTDGVK